MAWKARFLKAESNRKEAVERESAGKEAVSSEAQAYARSGFDALSGKSIVYNEWGNKYDLY